MNKPVATPLTEACRDTQAYMERSRIYRGTQFSRDEILLAAGQLLTDANALHHEVSVMSAAFNAERLVDCKTACERVAAAATRLSDRRAQQVAALAKSLVGTFATHLSRRPRA